MRRADVDIYRCPGCGSDRLSLSVVQEGGAGEVEVGELRCERCDAHYPVARGLPRFVGADNYAASFGLQWNLHRKTQLDSHTGLPISGIGSSPRPAGPRTCAGSGCWRRAPGRDGSPRCS